MRLSRILVALVVAGAGVLIAVPGAASADAPTDGIYVLPHTVDIIPTETNFPPILWATVTLKQGETRRIREHLALINTSGKAAEVDNTLECLNEDHASVAETDSGTNIMPSGAPVLLMQESLLLHAATAGTFTCQIEPQTGDGDRSYRLEALSTYPAVTPDGTTYLQIDQTDESGGKAWKYEHICNSDGTDSIYGKCIYLGGNQDPLTAYLDLPPQDGAATTWTAGPDATDYSLLGVIQATSCPSGSSSCRADQDGSGRLDDNGQPVTLDTWGQPSKLQTKAVMTQLYPDGTACVSQSSSAPTYTIDKNVHHLPIVYSFTGTVSPLCRGSRTFTMRVFYQYLGGDTVKVDEGEIDVVNGTRTTTATVPTIALGISGADTAEAAITAAGFVPHRLTAAPYAAPVGSVIDLNSPAGTVEPVGSEVDYTTSAGLPVVIHPPASIKSDAGVPYSGILTATGGIGPYTWSVTGLPPGLTADNTGHVFGTSQSTPATSFTPSARVVDSLGDIAYLGLGWHNFTLVPSVTGATPAAAPGIITAAGLVPRSSTNSTVCIDPGFVYAQFPGYTTEVAGGSYVDYTIDTSPKKCTVK